MTTVRLHEMIGTLRGRLAADGRGAATDAALLERFLTGRDEVAFAELVRRHGALVLGVCRRLLRDPHDAEDAFQATFLVLVRKGAAVRKQHSVASWLYGVARRTALEARRAAARRRVKEARAMPGSATQPDARDDLRDVLDEEIERLPDKLRAALVQCDLEGKTRKEAARALGWPEGTVASRLAHARKVLAGRLTRRGVTLGGGVAVAALAGEAASAGVPPALVGSTVRLAAGRAVLSSGVAALVKGVMVNMLVKKLKTGVIVLVATAVLGGGAVFRGAGVSEARADDKHSSPVEALRHENDLLKTNLHVLLEKVHAQEAELQALKGSTKAVGKVMGKGELILSTVQPDLAKVQPDMQGMIFQLQPKTATITLDATEQAKKYADQAQRYLVEGKEAGKVTTQFRITADPIQSVETALQILRVTKDETKDDKARQQAVQNLELALQVLKGHHPKKADGDK